MGGRALKLAQGIHYKISNESTLATRIVPMVQEMTTVYETEQWYRLFPSYLTNNLCFLVIPFVCPS